MEAIRRVASRIVVLPERDIDTDQIIPARYLKTTGERAPAARISPGRSTRRGS